MREQLQSPNTKQQEAVEFLKWIKIEMIKDGFDLKISNTEGLYELFKQTK